MASTNFDLHTEPVAHDGEPLAEHGANQRKANRDAKPGKQRRNRTRQFECSENFFPGCADGLQNLADCWIGRPKACDQVEQQRNERNEGDDGNYWRIPDAQPDHEGRGIADNGNDLDERDNGLDSAFHWAPSGHWYGKCERKNEGENQAGQCLSAGHD